MIASERVKSGLKYSAELIQNQFLQTVLTGLHDDTIRADVKPYLQDPEVKDEVLLEKVTMAYNLETERKNKLSSTSKARMIRVAMITEENEDMDKVVQAHKPDSKNKCDTLMEKVDQGNKAICEAIQNLTTQIASLQQTPQPQLVRMSDQPDRKYRLQSKTPNSKRCQMCQLSKAEGRCDHSYKCGSTEHWALGCRKKNASVSTNKIDIRLHHGEDMEKTDLFSVNTPLTGKQRQTAKLVGKRCLVGVDTTILWDTGSQVSIVGTNWKKSTCQTLRCDL